MGIKQLKSVTPGSRFALKGAFDISSLRKRESVPSLFFRTGINNNYFIKVKYLLNGEEKEHFKIIDLTRLHRKENINMNILDKSIEDLFKSINLEEEDDEEDEESDNGNDYNESNGNESNDNESNDNESNDNGNGNESNDNESNDNGSNYNELDIKFVNGIKSFHQTAKWRFFSYYCLRADTCQPVVILSV